MTYRTREVTYKGAKHKMDDATFHFTPVDEGEVGYIHTQRVLKTVNVHERDGVLYYTERI